MLNDEFTDAIADKYIELTAAHKALEIILDATKALDRDPNTPAIVSTLKHINELTRSLGDLLDSLTDAPIRES